VRPFLAIVGRIPQHAFEGDSLPGSGVVRRRQEKRLDLIRNQPWARALTMLSVDAKNAPGPLGAALVSRRSAGRYERAGLLHSAALVSSRKDWKAGRPLPQLSALPFNFELFAFCSPARLTLGLGRTQQRDDRSGLAAPGGAAVTRGRRRFKEITQARRALSACERTHTFRRHDLDYVVYCFARGGRCRSFPGPVRWRTHKA
jgi:hypothetical protein